MRYAAAHGLRLTVHAGETVGPEGIWGALRELKPDRIGHGLHAIDDPELVRYLAEKQIPVEVCITSNVKTGCCPALEQHPVRKLFRCRRAGRAEYRRSGHVPHRSDRANTGSRATSSISTRMTNFAMLAKNSLRASFPARRQKKGAAWPASNVRAPKPTAPSTTASRPIPASAAN